MVKRRLDADDQTFFEKTFNSLRPDSQQFLLDDRSPFGVVDVYVHSSRTVRQSTSADLSWVVAIYLCCNKKHRPQSRRLPQVGGSRGLLSQFNFFANRLRWKWYFKDSDEERSRDVIRGINTSDFFSAGIRSPPPLEAYISRLRQVIFKSATSSVEAQYGRRRWWCNSSLADSLAIKEMQSESFPFLPVPADKAGRFTLVTMQDLAIVHAEILSSEWYDSLDVHTTHRGLYLRAKWRYELAAKKRRQT